MTSTCSQRIIGEAHKRVNELGFNAPELALFQDEPPQMASGDIGKSGYLRLGFARRGDRSILARMERRVPIWYNGRCIGMRRCRRCRVYL